MRFFHLARPENIEEILSTGVLTPTGYPDLAACETLRLRGHDRPVSPEFFCPSYCTNRHKRTPVTWMYRTTHWLPMLGPSQDGYMMILDLPNARIWKRWALAQGAEERWVKAHPRLYDYGRMYEGHDEYVTLNPVPSTQWVRIMDMRIGREVWPERDLSPLPRMW